MAPRILAKKPQKSRQSRRDEIVRKLEQRFLKIIDDGLVSKGLHNNVRSLARAVGRVFADQEDRLLRLEEEHQVLTSSYRNHFHGFNSGNP